jgi:hypothetical protein
MSFVCPRPIVISGFETFQISKSWFHEIYLTQIQSLVRIAVIYFIELMIA